MLTSLLEPLPIKLVVSVIYHAEEHFLQARNRILSEFGPSDDDFISGVSDRMAFDFTDYYNAEMGTPLYRRLISLDDLQNRGCLAMTKLTTRRIEQEFLVCGQRQFNLDPGHLSLENFVLATSKPRDHRIYLGSGMYAEVTLSFRGGNFIPLPWTYPDYAGQELRARLNSIRMRYKEQIISCNP